MRHGVAGIPRLALVVLALTACSSAPPPVEALTLRVNSNIELINESKWEEAYEYLSPRLREACTKDDYVALMGMTFSLIRTISDLKQKGPQSIIGHTVRSVEVEGDIGRVSHRMFNYLPHVNTLQILEEGGDDENWIHLDGQWGWDSQNWVRVDGEWWYENDNSSLAQGCKIGDEWEWDENEERWMIRSG